MKQSNQKWLGAAILAIAAMVAAACTSGPSHFRRSVTVSNTFEQSRVLPDHQYHYFGRPHAPVAMVAIKDGYQLKAPKWTPIDLDDKQLGQWVRRMLNQPGSEYNTEANGAVISDGSGTPIGMWYSVWTLPILRFTSDTDIYISDPMTKFPITNRNPEGEPVTKVWQ